MRALALILCLALPASADGLHSRPGAAHSLVLGFDGHAPQQWGGYAVGAAAPYARPDAIPQAWSATAGYFAAYDLDVTTEPLANAKGKTGTVIVTGMTPFVGGVAGVSYPSGFFTDNPIVAIPSDAYVFAAVCRDDPLTVGRCAAHEAGHLFGLPDGASGLMGPGWATAADWSAADADALGQQLGFAITPEAWGLGWLIPAWLGLGRGRPTA